MNPIRNYWPNGRMEGEEYRNGSGQRHNTNGPAFRLWHESGRIECEMYYMHGQRHNANGSAMRWWYESGHMKHEGYYINGQPHNDNGSAIKSWYESGQLRREEYYINDMRHNANGPAYSVWHESGQLIEQEYFLNGKELEEDQWRDLTKPAEILRAISLLPYPIAVEVSRYYSKA